MVLRKENVLVVKKDNVLVLKKDNALGLRRDNVLGPGDRGTRVPGRYRGPGDPGTGVKNRKIPNAQGCVAPPLSQIFSSCGPEGSGCFINRTMIT